MDGLQYCRERVLVPGARLYLVRHFIDAELVPLLVVLEAFYAEIASVPERVSDSGVARSKLGWWQEEIQRCWQGQGRHPISQAAQQTGITERISDQDLIRLVMAIAEMIDAPPVATVDDMLGYCAAIGGSASRLEAKISCTDSQIHESANKLGTAHYLVAMIRDIGLDARANRWYIPLDLQARYQFNRDHAAAGERANEFESLVKALTVTARQLIEAATSGLKRTQLRQIRHLVIQAALDEKLIEKMLSNPNRILLQRVRISALVSLLTVWRAARMPGFE